MALRTYLTGIADAIREKKGTTDPINAQDFASEIASISTGGGGTGDNPLQTLVTGKGIYGGERLCYNYKGTNVDFLSNIDFSQTTSMAQMFYQSSNITTIPQLDTSKITNMERMLYHCDNLISVPPLNTSNATDMNSMFGSCGKLTTVPQLDTSSATNLSYLFSSCYKFESVLALNTNNATTMERMFNSCNVLTTIDITKLINKNTSFAYNCHKLTKLIIRTMDTIPTFGTSMFGNCYHFTGTANQYNPDGLQDGRIYVPDDKVDALKAATGWSEFADIIVPLSTLVED